MKQIVFIVQQLSQPRCIKRIDTIQTAGFPIKVYGFDNGLYSDNLKNLPFRIHEIIKRDKTKGRFSKILFFYSTIKRIIHENSHDSIFYLFGFEIGCIAHLLGCKNYIYEEADVSAARFSSAIIRNLLMTIDRRIIKKSKLTIFTSEGFADYIYSDKQRPNYIIFLPNKLHQYFDSEKRAAVKEKSFDINHIKFAFIGLIRYPNTIIRFAKVVGKYFPQHEFHFYGDPERESYIDNEIRNYKNIYFHGAFKNPTDLASIYSNIDISVVCYDTTSGNVRIAEPNKLYESIFFRTPIVVSSNTFLGRRVLDWKVGYEIDASLDNSIITFIKNLSSNQIASIGNTMNSFDCNELIDSPSELINKLHPII